MRFCGSSSSLPVMGAAIFLGLLGGGVSNAPSFFAPEAKSSLFFVAGEEQGEASKYAEVVKKEAVSNLVSTPIELFLRDLWAEAFHKSGKQVWKDMLFKLQGMIRFRAADKATRVVVYELKKFLYADGKANAQAWAKLERKFQAYMREWWVTVPEDPWAALHTGVWKALLKLYNEDLEPLMRGDPKLKELEAILFDSQLNVIRRWTDEDHVAVMRGNSSAILSRLDALNEAVQAKGKLRTAKGN